MTVDAQTKTEQKVSAFASTDSQGWAVVTGASGSIGAALTEGLARRGYPVVMACRNLKKAEPIRQQIMERSGNDRIVVRELNLVSMASIGAFISRLRQEAMPISRLLNNAGVMGLYEPQQLKEELSKLNATCYVSASSNYLTIVMEGFEETLPQACQLLSRQILMPKLDDKQLAQLKGNILSTRQQRKENVSTLNEALRQYLLYGDKSDYIDELTDKEVLELQISELTGDINRASNFESKIFYTGTLPFDNVYSILSQNLPLVANERPSESPRVKPMQAVSENTIYFLPNNDAEQAQIHFYLPMQTADKKDDVLRDAFNQYFGLDFTGLVLNEIREKRSMAYTAYAYAATQGIAGKASYLYGSIGTQNDKANDAIDVFMGLINDMPKNDDRIDNIKSYLRQSALTNHPDFRSKAMYLVNLGYQGYTEDPAKEQLPQIDALTFDDIVKFYETNIKGKPYAIAIMGNPKMIDLKKLEKYGKVVKLNDNKLFNTKDTLF